MLTSICIREGSELFVEGLGKIGEASEGVAVFSRSSSDSAAAFDGQRAESIIWGVDSTPYFYFCCIW